MNTAVPRNAMVLSGAIIDLDGKEVGGLELIQDLRASEATQGIRVIVHTVQASKELYGKLMGTIATKEKFEAKRLQLARNEWARMKAVDSRECRNCHSFDGMDTTKQMQRARKQHELAQRDKQTCIDCHKGISHNLPLGMTEADL